MCLHPNASKLLLRSDEEAAPNRPSTVSLATACETRHDAMLTRCEIVSLRAQHRVQSQDSRPRDSVEQKETYRSNTSRSLYIPWMAVLTGPIRRLISCRTKVEKSEAVKPRAGEGRTT